MLKNKVVALTIFFLSCSSCYSQQQKDSVFSEIFSKLINTTNSLAVELRAAGITSFSQWQDSLATNTIRSLVDTIRTKVQSLDVTASFRFPRYFNNGMPEPKSQDLSSKVTQLECSYLYYLKDLREAGDTLSNNIRAVLALQGWLAQGFPSSYYCPFIYSAVTIDFDKP